MAIETLGYSAQRCGNHSGNEPVVYFYCNRNEEQRRDPTAIMQAIVKQLSLLLSASHESLGSYGLPEPVVAKYEERSKDGFSSGPLGFHECQDLIVSLLDMNPQTTIIIDALDECDPTKRGRLLKALEILVGSSTKLVKIFVSSRDDDDITLKLKNVPNLYIEATDNKDDIERFIQREITLSIQESRLLRGNISEELKKKIISTLIENAHGM
jgi:hypothetical protein